MQNIGIEFPAQGEMAFFDLGPPPAPAQQRYGFAPSIQA